MGLQPIHCAAYKGFIDVINTLVEKYGADPQEKDKVHCVCSCIASYTYITY